MSLFKNIISSSFSVEKIFLLFFVFFLNYSKAKHVFITVTFTEAVEIKDVLMAVCHFWTNYKLLTATSDPFMVSVFMKISSDNHVKTTLDHIKIICTAFA